MFKNTRLQGDAGVAAALAYYTSKGWPVSLPFGEGQRYDLVVDRDGVLSRVQVKSGSTKAASGSPKVYLRTSGGNRSGTGKASLLSVAEADEVAVSADGKLWVFPIEELAGRTQVNLGDSRRHRIVLG